MPPEQRNEAETKQNKNSFETVLFQPKQYAPTVKRFSCFSQSLSPATVWGRNDDRHRSAPRYCWVGAQSADGMTCA